MTNHDDYRIASPFRYRQHVWALLCLACLLAGIGAGWVIPQFVGTSPEHNIWFMSSFGAAAILVLGSFAIQRAGSRTRRKQRETLRRGIDLKEVQKSLVHYGYQPPIVEARGFRTQLMKISRRSEVANTAPLIIVQHFDGAETLIRCEGISKDFVLQKGQMARIDFAINDFNRQIVFLPIEESGANTAYVLVHFIMNE
jgi:hypothetical protein